MLVGTNVSISSPDVTPRPPMAPKRLNVGHGADQIDEVVVGDKLKLLAGRLSLAVEVHEVAGVEENRVDAGNRDQRRAGLADHVTLGWKVQLLVRGDLEIGRPGRRVDREVHVLRDIARGGDADEVWPVGDRDRLRRIVMLVGEGVGELEHMSRQALVDRDTRIEPQRHQVSCAEGEIAGLAGGMGRLHQMAVGDPVLASADEIRGWGLGRDVHQEGGIE